MCAQLMQRVYPSPRSCGLWVKQAAQESIAPSSFCTHPRLRAGPQLNYITNAIIRGERQREREGSGDAQNQREGSWDRPRKQRSETDQEKGTRSRLHAVADLNIGKGDKIGEEMAWIGKQGQAHGDELGQTG